MIRIVIEREFLAAETHIDDPYAGRKQVRIVENPLQTADQALIGCDQPVFRIIAKNVHAVDRGVRCYTHHIDEVVLCTDNSCHMSSVILDVLAARARTEEIEGIHAGHLRPQSQIRMSEIETRVHDSNTDAGTRPIRSAWSSADALNARRHDL